MMVLVGIAALAKLAFLIWVGVTPGTPGANAYGPAPGSASVPVG